MKLIKRNKRKINQVSITNRILKDIDKFFDIKFNFKIYRKINYFLNSISYIIDDNYIINIKTEFHSLDFYYIYKIKMYSLNNSLIIDEKYIDLYSSIIKYLKEE